MESGSRTSSWEEEIYWNNFQYTHFSTFLHSDFNTHLVIPARFAKKMRTKLPATVNLKGPSRNSWSVGVESSNDETLFFSSGWKEFAQDHCLHSTNLLIFRYNGDALFDVLVFDLESSCEKASSYFARKKETRKKMRGDTPATTSSTGFIAPSPEQQNQTGDTKPSTCQPVISESPKKRARTGWTKPTASRDWKSAPEKSRRRALKLASYFTARKQGTGNKIKRARAEMENPVNHSGWKPAAEESNQKVLKSASYFCVQNQEMGGSTTATKSVSSEGFVCNDSDINKGTPPAAEKSGEDGNGIHTKTPALPTCPPIICELSNKRAREELTKPVVMNNDSWKTVSEESKLKAIRAARYALKEDGFITVMKTTHVKTCFYMTIPMAWMKTHMDGREKQEVILRVGGGEWRVRYKLREKRDSGGLTHGWRTFAEDNSLKQFDVCLFQPSKSSYNVPGADAAADIVLDVEIFRC